MAIFVKIKSSYLLEETHDKAKQLENRLQQKKGIELTMPFLKLS